MMLGGFALCYCVRCRTPSYYRSVCKIVSSYIANEVNKEFKSKNIQFVFQAVRKRTIQQRNREEVATYIEYDILVRRTDVVEQQPAEEENIEIVFGNGNQQPENEPQVEGDAITQEGKGREIQIHIHRKHLIASNELHVRQK